MHHARNRVAHPICVGIPYRFAYRARPAFHTDPQMAGLADSKAEFAPHSHEAERMLGVVSYDQDTAADMSHPHLAPSGRANQ